MTTTFSFNAMLLEHLPRLRPYAMSLTRNWAGADDLLQEAAYLALRGQRHFVIGTNFKAWLTCIVRNAFISSLRRTKRATISIDEAPESALVLPPVQEYAIYNRQVAEAIDQLDIQQREILALICDDGLSYIDAAKSVDCAIGTVKSRLWRARRQLNALLADGPTAATVVSAAHPFNAATVFTREQSTNAAFAQAA